MYFFQLQYMQQIDCNHRILVGKVRYILLNRSYTMKKLVSLLLAVIMVMNI